MNQLLISLSDDVKDKVKHLTTYEDTAKELVKMYRCILDIVEAKLGKFADIQGDMRTPKGLLTLAEKFLTVIKDLVRLHETRGLKQTTRETFSHSTYVRVVSYLPEDLRQEHNTTILKI